MAVLEALSMGKPVICSPVGALAEIIQDKQNGYLVLPGDLSELEIAIINLIRNREERNQMGKTNYYYARKFFSQEIISLRLANFFNLILHTHFIVKS